MMESRVLDPTRAFSGKRTRQKHAETDAFAQRIIQEESAGSSASVDENLGPYITGRLRNADPSVQLSELPEFYSLVELLQEHCHIPQNTAERTLHRISDVLLSESASHYLTHAHHNHPDSVPISPVAAGSLLPVNLLDEEGGQAARSAVHAPPPPLVQGSLDTDAFPPLGSTGPVSHKKTANASRKTDSATGQSVGSTENVIATQFQTTRSRQSSIDETALVYNVNEPTTDVQHQYQEYYYSTSELLLSMNAELSPEAALAAATMAGADVNVAQYIVEATVSQVPICRNLVTGDGCYRADCTFHHDIDNYTCLFWLKSRCGKGAQCRFLHGFSNQLLQNVQYASSGFENDGVDLYQPPYQEQPDESWQAQQSSANSFAIVASQGYDTRQSFANGEEFPSLSSKPQRLRTVPIPQDLWNTHENRDSSVFHIADPMERYFAVQKQTGCFREDVIDLHFQSLQTFSFVLDAELDKKLNSVESVWVITGTGHHVGSRTHQKGGGALESAVLEYLQHVDRYAVFRGRDRGGKGGALMVQKK